jgi:short-subunit dehydrogenase
MTQIAAVTGGARGIGAAIAAAMVGESMTVAIGDREVDLAEETAERLGPRAHAFALDVADLSSYTTFLDTVESQLGPLSVLVNNAGIMPAGAFTDETPAATARQVEVNIFGVTNGCRLMLPRFISRGRGQIVNVSSAAGKGGFPGIATYSGTKFFVYGFSDALRGELAGTGVEISVVMPGFVATELTAGFGNARFYKKISPQDVADGVLDAIRKPRFEVFVPKALGPMTKVSGLLPARTRDALTRLAKADRLALDYDRSGRAAYELRAAQGDQGVLASGAEPPVESLALPAGDDLR